MPNFKNHEIIKKGAEVVKIAEGIENADSIKNVKKIDIPQERIRESLIALWADMYGGRAEQVERM